MIKFYPERTKEEQASRLPLAFQENYKATVLDQIEIDGNTIRGYMEYSFLNEKSYFEQPVRSDNGSIENINSYATFLTPRLIIKYSMMNIEDYRKLMMLLQSKNEFTVTCYDPVLDDRVTHKMYAAPTQMPIIYQQYLMAMGVQEFSLELIGTNNDVKEYVVVYDYNIPSQYESLCPAPHLAMQTFYHNASGIIGEGANSSNFGQIKNILKPYYEFKCWNTIKDGTGFNYIDGEAYFTHTSRTLHAQWRKI